MVGQWLALEDVESRPCDLAGVERSLEVLVDDQRATSDVENPHPILHLGERLSVKPALRFRRFGQVERDEVGLGVKLLGALGLSHAKLAVALSADEWIEGDHRHSKRLGASGNKLTYAAETENAERLVQQLDTGVLRTLPAALG